MVPGPFPEAWNPSEQWQGGIGRGRRRRRRKRLSLGVDVVVSFVEGRGRCARQDLVRYLRFISSIWWTLHSPHAYGHISRISAIFSIDFVGVVVLLLSVVAIVLLLGKASMRDREREVDAPLLE